MKTATLVLLALIAGAPAYAEEPKSFDETMQDVASDLTKLQAEIQSAYQKREAMIRLLRELEALNILRSKSVKVTADIGQIYLGADQKSKLIETVQNGKNLEVVDKAGTWYAVELEPPYQDIKTGWVNAAQVVPEISAPTKKPPLDLTLYESLMAKMKALRDKYETNPYVTVKGFSVDLGFSPSLSISFEFT